MKDSELQFDRNCHVLYSKPCKKEILAKIALHYPEARREAVWEQVQRGSMQPFSRTGAPTLAAQKISTTVRAAPTTASPS